MPARRMRVELFDTEGNRYVVSFEGDVTRDKALRLLDLVELLGGVPGSPSAPGPNPAAVSEELSKYSKVCAIVRKHFPVVWFSSREVQSDYEQEFKQPISLSTVATYLARMAAKGVIIRNGPPNNLRHRVAPGFPQATIKQRLM